MKAIACLRAVSLLAGIAMLTGCVGSSSTPALPPDFTLTVSPQSVSVPIGIGGGTSPGSAAKRVVTHKVALIYDIILGSGEGF